MMSVGASYFTVTKTDNGVVYAIHTVETPETDKTFTLSNGLSYRRSDGRRIENGVVKYNETDYATPYHSDEHDAFLSVQDMAKARADMSSYIEMHIWGCTLDTIEKVHALVKQDKADGLD